MDRENVLYEMRFHFDRVFSSYQQFKVQNDIFKRHEFEALKSLTQSPKMDLQDEYQRLLKVQEEQSFDYALMAPLNRVLISLPDQSNAQVRLHFHKKLADMY